MEEHIHRRSRIAVLIATVAIVAAACGSTSSSGSPAASTGASSAAAPSTGGSAGPSGSAAAGGGDLAGQSVTVIGTWGGDEEKAFRQMVAPWEAQTGAKMNYNRHPRPQHGPHDRRRLGRPARPGRAARSGPDGPVADSLVDLGGVLDVPTYTSETAPALVELGKVNGKQVGVLHQDRSQGPDLVRPEGPCRHRHDTPGDLGRPPDGHHHRQVEGRFTVVPRRRVGCRLRLAGHGLDRGPRPPPGRS